MSPKRKPKPFCKTCLTNLRRAEGNKARFYCPKCTPTDTTPERQPSKVKFYCPKCESLMRVVQIDGVPIGRICPLCTSGTSDGKPPVTPVERRQEKSENGFHKSGKKAEASKVAIPPMPAPTPTSSKKLTFKDRIRRPHILGQMIQSSSQLSSKSQSEYLTVLEAIVTELRSQLENAKLVQSISVDHKRLWKDCAGKKIAFIDGGVANMGALGAAPVAIRVGSYMVIPGCQDSDREVFDIEVQLVEDLYQSTRSESGFYEDMIEDTDKLRDVARITLETSGAMRVAHREKPDFLFLHGPLINPVSMYSFTGFPAFSPKGLELLLPEGERLREGNDANFVRVHLRQLEILSESKSVICGVVERTSLSAILSHTLLNKLVEMGGMTTQDSSVIRERLRDYKISDGILFDCLLDEGEYLIPITVDRNAYIPGRVPPQWIPDLQKYPKPVVSYMKPSNMSLPLRVEMFECPENQQRKIFDLLIHSCRLLPKYSFPAGLDIVDKHAKIPAWMSKPVNAHLMAQVMKKALDSKNPILINEVRRLMCGTARDWLFRPSFNNM